MVKFPPVLNMSVLQQERNYGAIINVEKSSAINKYPVNIRKVILGQNLMNVLNLEISSPRSHNSRYI